MEFSVAAHLANGSKAIATLLQRVRHASSKMDKGDLRTFHQNHRAIISLRKKTVFLCSDVEPFGYDNASNEGTVTFLAKCEAISPFIRKQGDEATNLITGY